jgi:predicted nucleotidyltransferase
MTNDCHLPEASLMLKIDCERLNEIAQRFGLDLSVLFGSHAKGRAIAGSDVDIAALRYDDDEPRRERLAEYLTGLFSSVTLSGAKGLYAV